ncbi:MAG: serine/threonine protein kinase [Polyangiaceae bacterium]|nr:serine/threonine protein kinase [Polyangiaceae bacterium]
MDRGERGARLLAGTGTLPCVDPVIESVRTEPVAEPPSARPDSGGRVRLNSLQAPPAPQPHHELTREHAGRYALEPGEATELGRGAIGRVLLAFDRHLGREVAVKELLPGGDPGSATGTQSVPGPDARERFLTEARVTGQLEHPAIVPVYELGERADGTLYYTMRAVRGRTLSSAIAAAKTRRQRLELVARFADLCQAIAYAHSRGVIHRDIKPDNVMIGEFGETVVLDWGLAKIRGARDLRRQDAAGARRIRDSARTHETAYGDICGTPAYMSPEQALGHLDDIDERSDVWSLGAVLYTLLAGRPPFMGTSVLNVLSEVVAGRAAPLAELDPTLPPELVAIAERAMAPERQDRYPSARELVRDVEAFQSGARVAAYEYSSWELVARFVERNRAAVIVGLIGLTLATGLGATSYHRVLAARDRALAAERRALHNAEQARHSLAEAVVEKAQTALFEGDAVAAELLAARALELEERPDARGVAVAASNLPRAAPSRDLPELRGCERLAFAPKAGLLVCARGRELYAVDTTARTGAHPLAVSEGPWTAVGTAPSGELVAAGRTDGAVSLYRGTARVASWTGNGTAVTRIAVSPDAERIVTGDGRGRLLVRHSSDGSIARDVLLGGAVTSLAFSPDGKRVCVGGRTGRVAVFDASRRAEPVDLPGHTGTVHGVAFSPNAELVVSGAADRSLRLHDATTGQSLGDPLVVQSAVLDVAWSTDGRQILYGNQDGSVWLLDARLRARPVLLNGPSDSVTLVAFSSQAPLLVSASAKRGARLWSAISTEPPRLVGRSNILALAATPDPRRILSAGLASEGICLWDLTSGQCTARLPAGAEGARAVAVSPDGTSLAAAGSRGSVVIWDLRDLVPHRVLEGHRAEVRGLVYAPDGHGLASGSLDGTVVFWSVLAESPLAAVPLGSPVQALAISPDGHVVAAASRDGMLRLLDVRSHQQQLGFHAHEDWATAVAFSGDGRCLVTGGGEGTIKLWSRDGRALRSVDAHRGRVTSVAVSTDGLWLATTGEDAIVRVWGMSDLKLRATLTGHDGIVRAALWRGGQLLSGGDDGTVRLWRAAELATPPRQLLRTTEKRYGVRLEDARVVVQGVGAE